MALFLLYHLDVDLGLIPYPPWRRIWQTFSGSLYSSYIHTRKCTDYSGTEQDRVNCSFYLKIGACRHGDKCSRKHIKPQFSQTILLANVYNNPAHALEGGSKMSKEELQRDFDRFYEDFYIELCKLGHVQEVHVCDNVGDHLMGNVYVRFEWEAEASKAVDALNDRWYALQPLHAELSPVSDFREACCRQNEMGECKREG